MPLYDENGNRTVPKESSESLSSPPVVESPQEALDIFPDLDKATEQQEAEYQMFNRAWWVAGLHQNDIQQLLQVTGDYRKLIAVLAYLHMALTIQVPGYLPAFATLARLFHEQLGPEIEKGRETMGKRGDTGILLMYPKLDGPGEVIQ